MKTLNVKAVFLDFDDTLQSRKDAYRLYCERFLQKYFPYDSRSERENKLYEMEALVDGGYKPREEYFPQLIQLWQWKNHPPLQELYDSFNLEYGKRVVMLPGAVETVRELKRRGYILGMITNGNSDLQNMKLDTAGIRDLFDVCVVSGDIGIGKPDRRIFEASLKRAGVRPEEAVFIGDHPLNDIKGALGAGMKVIRMNYGDFYGRGLDGSEVYPVIEHLPEALDFLPPRNSTAPSRVEIRRAPANAPEKKGKKGRALAIKIIAIFCAVIMAALAVVGSVTDVFNEDNSEKTILFSSLKGEKKDSLQSFINGYCAYFEEGYDSSKENFDTVLDHLSPGSSAGLISGVLSSSRVLTDGSDPAGRFAPGRRITGYSVVEKSEMDKISSGLSQTLLTDTNTRSAYYYNGSFYVAAASGSESDSRLYAVIDSSSEVNTGGYYLSCKIFESADALQNPDSQSEKFVRYFLVDSDEVGGEYNWAIKKITASPIFNASGSKIEEEKEENFLTYSFKRKSMKATTSDGTLFAEYFIEYPNFGSDGIAQAACESVYSEKIDEFRTHVASADSFYEAYIADGGDESLLPLRTNVVVNVTYNRDGYISLVDRTTIYDPTPVKATPEETETAAGEGTTIGLSTTEETTASFSTEQNTASFSTEQNTDLNNPTEIGEISEGETGETAQSEKEIILPSVQYTGYTFEIDSGSFIKKDELTGNNYAAFSQKLFDKYIAAYGAEQSGIGYYDEYGNYVYGSESDAESIGTEIFNSSWSISDEGMNFYYIDGDGLLSTVTVPWNELGERTVLV